jgi:hypothetical protein
MTYVITEFLHSFGQLLISGDDMNIIQVGRPAVSRYHQTNKYYAEGEGPNYAVHDFPNAKYGIKLGGFMIRGGHSLTSHVQRRKLGIWISCSIYYTILDLLPVYFK